MYFSPPCFLCHPFRLHPQRGGPLGSKASAAVANLSAAMAATNIAVEEAEQQLQHDTVMAAAAPGAQSSAAPTAAVWAQPVGARPTAAAAAAAVGGQPAVALPAAHAANAGAQPAASSGASGLSLTPIRRQQRAAREYHEALQRLNEAAAEVAGLWTELQVEGGEPIRRPYLTSRAEWREGGAEWREGAGVEGGGAIFRQYITGNGSCLSTSKTADHTSTESTGFPALY